MKLLNRVRLERAVLAYDFWLELRGVRPKDRSAMRRELRANLNDAARDSGAREAIAGAGSPRTLAAEAAPIPARRPRWIVGANAALATLVLVYLAALYTCVTVFQTIKASGVHDDVHVAVIPWWGATFGGHVAPDSMWARFDVGPSVLVLPLLVFVLVSRPWRALRRA